MSKFRYTPEPRIADFWGVTPLEAVDVIADSPMDRAVVIIHLADNPAKCAIVTPSDLTPFDEVDDERVR
jgi:hypothetical protein